VDKSVKRLQMFYLSTFSMSD